MIQVNVSGSGEGRIAIHLDGSIVVARAVSGNGNISCIRNAERSVKAERSVGAGGGVVFHGDVAVVGKRGVAEDGHAAHLHANYFRK